LPRSGREPQFVQEEKVAKITKKRIINDEKSIPLFIRKKTYFPRIFSGRKKKKEENCKKKRVLDFLHQVLVNQIRIFSIFLKKQIF